MVNGEIVTKFKPFCRCRSVSLQTATIFFFFLCCIIDSVCTDAYGINAGEFHRGPAFLHWGSH